MRLGLFLAYQRIHEPERYEANLFQEMLEEAVEADRLGFEVIWIPEHHLIHLMQAPSVAVLATHIGMAVKCKVATMVTLLNYRHPLITAGEMATVDNILQGRFEIGIGRGAYEYEFERLGIPFKEGKERFAEAMEALETIWGSDEAVSFEGKFHQWDEAFVWPRPYQHPRPPMWVAAMTPPTIDWAVRAGYHVTNWPFLRDFSAVQSVCDIFHGAREEIGVARGEQRLGMLRGAYVAETEAEAREVLEDAIIAHRINQRLHYFTQNSNKHGYVQPEPVQNEPTPDEIYENLLIGTPDQVLEKLEMYHEAGIDDMLLNFDFGPPTDKVMRSLGLFADEVMRPYRERHPQEQIVVSNKIPARQAV
jgi:alkanesulfonate monooxygenase SsuD/methylene tetrahydromethanopterin reductase-like flavin-dependent oxidoreductase (luciferase family)